MFFYISVMLLCCISFVKDRAERYTEHWLQKTERLFKAASVRTFATFSKGRSKTSGEVASISRKGFFPEILDVGKTRRKSLE